MEIIRRPYPIPGTPDDDTALIAIGDIHGKYGLFQNCLDTARKLIPENAKKIQLVLLGDILDRGDAALEVLDQLMQGIEDWEIIPILGNHEQLLLRVLEADNETYRIKWALWYGNGGTQTLENLQIGLPELKEIGVSDHRQALVAALGQNRIDYINRFSSHHISGNILCVHAGIDPKLTLEENFSMDRLSQAINHWAWIREDFLDHAGPYPEGMFVVHGHTVIPGPKMEPHRIGLDTGACLYGVMSGALFYKQHMTIFQVTQD